jgi:hypothetical protein
MAFLRPESAMRSLVRANATVQSLANADTTFCPIDDVPRNALMPFMCYQRIEASPEHHMGGVSSSGLWMGTTEISVFAETMDAACSLADAVRAVLDGNDSATVTISGNTCNFERLHLRREDIETFDPKDSSDSRVHVVTQEYEWSARP